METKIFVDDYLGMVISLFHFVIQYNYVYHKYFCQLVTQKVIVKAIDRFQLPMHSTSERIL